MTNRQIGVHDLFQGNQFWVQRSAQAESLQLVPHRNSGPSPTWLIQPTQQQLLVIQTEYQPRTTDWMGVQDCGTLLALILTTTKAS